ncbi:MAG TPA: universal stress protein [Conexibacter sp.]|nr:universal stress protein [Conexibacter sp.]
MFSTIVSGYDGSSNARDGLALATLIASACDARLTAASVYVFHPIHREGDGEVERYVRETAQERLADVEELTHGRAATTLVRGHSVPEGLQRCAHELAADLLVVGSTHHGNIGRALAGDVPERLLQGSECAVAIAPHGYGATDPPPALRTIGVGYDGSREARAALDAAAELARAAGARLQVITAFTPHISGLTPRMLAELELAEYLAEGRQQLADRQAAEVARLRAAGVDATAVADDDEEADALTARSRTLDLLVLGSRSYGPWKRLLLGSVSAQLMKRSACPLLLIPRGAMPQDEADGDRPRSVERPA